MQTEVILTIANFLKDTIRDGRRRELDAFKAQTEGTQCSDLVISELTQWADIEHRTAVHQFRQDTRNRFTLPSSERKETVTACFCLEGRDGIESFQLAFIEAIKLQFSLRRQTSGEADER